MSPHRPTPGSAHPPARPKLLAALALSLLLAPAAPAQSVDLDATTLETPARPRQARAESARRLLAAASDDPASRARIELILNSAPAPQPAPEDGDDARVILLREISLTPSAPAWLVAPLTTLAADGPMPQRVLAVTALGSVRTRDALSHLLAFSDNPEPALADSALRAMARLTGKPEFGADRKQWALWFSQVQWLPEAEWRRVLAESLAAAADLAAAQRDRAESRTADLLRRRFQAAQPGDERTALVVELLEDQAPAAKRLGLQLAMQELANARPIGPDAARAAAAILRDPRPECRRDAAELLNVLATAPLAPAINDALIFEPDPAVAAWLLKAVARWPIDRSIPTVLRWLESDGPARAPAMDTLAAILDQGIPISDDVRRRALTLLRSIPTHTLPPSGLRLLVSLGETADAESVARLLDHPDLARRTSAAEALAALPGTEGEAGLDRILLAAADDPALFATASHALQMRRATPQGVAQLSALPSPTPEARQAELLALAARLSPSDLLAVALVTPDPALREQMLARLTGEPLFAGPGRGMPGASSTSHPDVIAGLLLLAQTRLDLRQPGQALKALESIEPARASIDHEILDTLWVIALVELARVDEAARLNAPAAAWIDALERVADQPQALATLSTIESAFGATLPPDQALRVNTARARLGRIIGPMPDRASDRAPDQSGQTKGS